MPDGHRTGIAFQMERPVLDIMDVGSANAASPQAQQDIVSSYIGIVRRVYADIVRPVDGDDTHLDCFVHGISP